MDSAQGLPLLNDAAERLRAFLNGGADPEQSEGTTGETASATSPETQSAENAETPAADSQTGMSLNLTDAEMAEFITEVYEYIDNSESAMLHLEKDPADSASLNEVFRCFHNIKGITGFMNITDMNELAHHAESLMDQARNGSIRFEGAVADVIFEALDFIKEMTARIENAGAGTPYATPSGLDGLVAALQDPEKFVARRKESDETATAGEDNAPDEPAPGLSRDETRNKSGNGAATKATSVRVSTERLDNLIDFVGELVIANSVVFQGVTGLNGKLAKKEKRKMVQDVSHLGKVTRELQELAMSMRMVTLAATFNKMARVARDTAHKSGVSIDFSFSGEETEIDRNVVEEIASPLMHMIRNSIDHGIEAPEIRLAAGKPEDGNVHLSAAHEGGNVVIKIEDDGRGLDRDAILSKARSQGIISDGDELADEDVHQLIFHPGFSTAEKVTDVSGRGVGMDVVRQNIEKLRGAVDIDSRPGRGCTFSIRLPLTLAIIDGMAITVGGEQFILPTNSIQESIRPAPDQVATVMDRGEMVNVRGSLVPLFRLHELYGIEGAKQDPCEGLVLLVGTGRCCALLVDELLGQRQVVIKKLGKVFDKVEGIAGGAIMGDGNVALILDPVTLSKLAHKGNKHEKQIIE